jgi:hypothetical protein
MTTRFRFAGNEVRSRTHDARDEANKKLVAVHKGRHQVAERNSEGDLEIYSLTDERGMPAQESAATNDYRPPTLADRNRAAEAFWARGRGAA